MQNQIEFIKNAVKLAIPKTLGLRHKIHENPELSFEEVSTQELISKRLTELQIEHKTNIAKTGILAIITGTKPTNNPTKTVLIRGDMDALPVLENTNLLFSSKNNGVMHACGHDIHTAVLLCCAEVLSQNKDKFSGNVKLMFQPGEETTGGALPMIKSGILINPNVDTCIALHVEPSLYVGQVRLKSGAAYSSPDEFTIKIIGKGGHAAYPHQCIDPIVISANIISQLQTISSRMVDPFEPVVVSVCSIHGGTAFNVIPDEVNILGTARSFSAKARDLLEEKIEVVVKNICNLHGAGYEYKFNRLFPSLINDKETIDKLTDSAKKFLEPENVLIGGNPTAAGEDFAYLPLDVASSALFWLGSTDSGSEIHPLHSDKFVASDDCIQFGAEIFLDYTLNFLNTDSND